MGLKLVSRLQNGKKFKSTNMIGALLKENRQKRNLTQKQLGEKAKISFVAVNRIERGAMPRLSIATRLFEAMELDLVITAKERGVS